MLVEACRWSACMRVKSGGAHMLQSQSVGEDQPLVASPEDVELAQAL